MSKCDVLSKYGDFDGVITHEMLNKAYGYAGMFYKTMSEARAHQLLAGGQIYTIRNYHGSDFDGCHLRPGAKPYIEGYYVSHPPKAAETAYASRVAPAVKRVI